MKKVFSLLISGILAASVLAGCGSAVPSTSSESHGDNSAASASTASSEASALTTSGADSEAGTDSTSGSGKTLVLYYSASGTTKGIADMIAKDTGADEYEVKPSDSYTDDDLDWTDDNSRVNKEHNDESLQDVKFDSTDVPNWSSYDTVFVGYPIWWQDASWVMKSFVKNLDFTGKKVIPFCTSISSDIGKSGDNLKSLAGNKGDWLDGQRFSGGASESEVKDWVDSLNL